MLERKFRFFRLPKSLNIPRGRKIVRFLRLLKALNFPYCYIPVVIQIKHFHSRLLKPLNAPSVVVSEGAFPQHTRKEF